MGDFRVENPQAASAPGNLTGPITSVGLATSVASQTGTGSTFVMDTSPTLITPLLGTPTSGVMTNVTGTAASLTAGNVTTNANLTGPITSVGNTTSVAAQTGTGSVFVMQATPTLTTPLLGTPTSGNLATCTGYTYANLPTLASGRLIVGSAGGVPTVKDITGDVTLTSGGVTAIRSTVSLTTPNINAATGTSLALSGKMGTYNNIATVSNGMPSEYATIDSTGLTANVGATTLYAVPASGVGMYRVNAYVVETTAGSITSTLPNVQIVYTDFDTNGAITIDTTPVLGVAGIGQTGALTANTVGTASSGVIVIYVKASTTIQYQTVNYASNIAGMAYSLRIKLEAL